MRSQQQINEWLTEITDMKEELKEVDNDEYQCNLKLKDEKKVIKQANTICKKRSLKNQLTRCTQLSME